jgi:hypothetical protein
MLQVPHMSFLPFSLRQDSGAASPYPWGFPLFERWISIRRLSPCNGFIFVKFYIIMNHW